MLEVSASVKGHVPSGNRFNGLVVLSKTHQRFGALLQRGNIEVGLPAQDGHKCRAATCSTQLAQQPTCNSNETMAGLQRLNARLPS